jgi:hypothetical protein
MSAVPIPQHMRAEAEIRGLDPRLIDAKWDEHVAWVRANRPDGDFGGRAWTKFVDAVVAELRGGAERDQLREERRRREIRQEREAQAHADAEYARHAISLREWVTQLQIRLKCGDVLPDHEHAVATFRYPLPFENLGDWLGAAVYEFAERKKEGTRNGH